MGPDVRPAEAPPQDVGRGLKIASARADEGDERFWLALSDGQVQDLVQQEAVSRGGGGRGLFRVVLALDGLGERIGMDELARDERYRSGRISQSVVHGLVVLGAFALGEAHGVNSLAEDLGMSPTTTWRYLKTWAELGVLEERKDRRYKLARRWMGYLSEPAKSGRPRPAR